MMMNTGSGHRINFEVKVGLRLAVCYYAYPDDEPHLALLTIN
jgi:hypothetical protein